MFQVVIAFGDPEFFKVVFPLLLEMYNSAALNKPDRATLANDTDKAGSKIKSGSLELLIFNLIREEQKLNKIELRTNLKTLRYNFKLYICKLSFLYFWSACRVYDFYFIFVNEL